MANFSDERVRQGRAIADPESMGDLSWPDGCDACVALTFDLDADVAAERREFGERLTSRSEARYGTMRGIHRVLQTLYNRGLRASFYVPGEIADVYPDLIKEVSDCGHEIGHHGYQHLAPDRATPADQRAEVERGIESLSRCIGYAPAGYRSPSWELTPVTLSLLNEYRFKWDSSCMGDDRPYLERFDDMQILEFPVHWSLDDWVYFSFARDGGGTMSSPEAFLQTWLLEFESALAERRMVSYTMHPEVIGRGYRISLLEQFLDTVSGMGRIWFATHGEVAEQIGCSRYG